MSARRLLLLLTAASLAALSVLFAIGAYLGRHRGLPEGQECPVCQRRQ